MLDGLPKYMVPILKGSLLPATDLLQFRRILLDYEDGLRHTGSWKNSFNSNTRNTTVQDGSAKESLSYDIKNKDISKPPRPCSCGGMHWYNDCPLKASRSNNAYAAHASPNRLPVTGSTWPRYQPTRSNTQTPCTLDRQTDVSTNIAVVELCLPEQDNDGFDELYSSICNYSTIYYPLAYDLPSPHQNIVKSELQLPIMPEANSYQYFSSAQGSCPTLSDNEKEYTQHSTLGTALAKCNARFTLALPGPQAGLEDRKDGFYNDSRQVNEISEADHVPIPGCERKPPLKTRVFLISQACHSFNTSRND
jgi:hypothetical protein